MAEDKAIAKSTDWDIEKMPWLRRHLKLKRTFTRAEMQELRYGNIPGDMEDRWFWYMEGNTLYAHRSWSGVCIFTVEFHEDTGIHRVTVNRYRKQYASKSSKDDLAMIQDLLDQWAKHDTSYRE